MDKRYKVMFIDGPKHGVVVQFDSWPGLLLRFPVSFNETNFPPPIEVIAWPREATYYNWARVGSLLVFKFEGTK